MLGYAESVGIEITAIQENALQPPVLGLSEPSRVFGSLQHRTPTARGSYGYMKLLTDWSEQGLQVDLLGNHLNVVLFALPPIGSIVFLRI